MSLPEIYRNFIPTFWSPAESFSSSNPREEEPPPEKGLWDIAVEIWNVVKWLFKAFRENFIVCYLSKNISEADRSVQVAIPRMIGTWFAAENIPFSSRMNPEALVEGLKAIEAFNNGTLPAIIAAYAEKRSLAIGEAISLEMSAEDFVREHVMSLAGDQTIDIHNPAEGFAFWRSSLNLKQDFLTLEKSVLKDLKGRMGTDLDLDIDLFVEFCRDKMGPLKNQLELLLLSDEE